MRVCALPIHSLWSLCPYPASLPVLLWPLSKSRHEIPGLIKPTGTDGPLAVSAIYQPYTATVNVAKCFCRGGVWELGARAGGGRG